MRRSFALTAVIAMCSACSAETASPGSESATASFPSQTLPPSTTQDASPSVASTPEPESDEWVEVASFGTDGTIETVNAIVEAPFGLVAAGVHVGAQNLNVFGELPQDGRIWLSSDGASWEDVTPAGTFADASVDRLIVLPDGAVVAFGRVNEVDPASGSTFQAYAEWETFDGRTWTDVDLSAESSPIYDIVQGDRGYLAVLSVPFRSQLAHSVDGRTFVDVAEEASSRVSRGLGAGPEGFVVIGQAYESAESPKAYASGNGTDWIEATAPDWNPVGVAPLGTDWVVVERAPIDLASEAILPARTWISANGLDWTGSGGVELRDVPVSDGNSCRELISGVSSTGSLVVVSSTLSYPCGEGNVQNFGTSSSSSDGVTWTALPFTVRPPASGVGLSRGATVRSGLDIASGTLLVGESGSRATFWFRPAD